MGNLYIYIGTQKAASSTIQGNLFRHHPDICDLLAIPGWDKDILEPIWLYSNEQFSASSSELRNKVTEHLAEVSSNNKCVIFGHQNLSRGVGVPNDVKASRLKFLFGDARIFIVLRRQDEVLKSEYLFGHFKTGRGQSFDHWLEDNMDYIRTTMDYASMLDAYTEVFGRKNLMTFFFEDLTRNPDEFARVLASYLTIGSDRAIELMRQITKTRGSARRVKVTRLLRYVGDVNRDHIKALMPSSILEPISAWLARGPRAEVGFPKDYWLTDGAMILSSNLRLRVEYQLPIERLQYPLPESVSG